MRYLSFFLKSLAFIVFTVTGNYCYADGSPEVFKKYPNNYFVAVGKNTNVEIKQALQAGFPKVVGLEFDHSLYAKMKKKYKGKTDIKVYRGKSKSSLANAIKNLKSPITFWLDGEFKEMGKSEGTKYFSIMQELDQISSHPINTHTIMIDDVRTIGSLAFDVVALNEIILRILKINPDYSIGFEKGNYENDILVAFIDEDL